MHSTIPFCLVYLGLITIPLLKKRKIRNLDGVRICATEPKQRDGEYAHRKDASKPALYNFWMITTRNKHKQNVVLSLMSC